LLARIPINNLFNPLKSVKSVVFFKQEVDIAVDALLFQQVILYPTDTVWGLGCDAEVPRAVEKLYKLKGRPEGTPSIVLVADLDMLRRYASTVPPELEHLLATQARPTTYILPASPAVAKNLVAPDGTVGLRVVQDEFCHKMVRRLGHGLVSTSANKAGEPTPAVYAEVDSAIVRGADHVVSWRQDDTTRAAPSRVVRLGAGGQLEVVRE
jgi:L-threonylcarbamoyladenylate synthase